MFGSFYRLVREFQAEKEDERRRKERQPVENGTSSLLQPLSVLAIFLGLQTAHLLLGSKTKTPRESLENDPQCGLTTGGQQECYWDCQSFSADFTTGPIAVEPECLADCFPPDHCVNFLLEDFTANGGICSNGLFASSFSDRNPWPVSQTSCVQNPIFELTSGVCSPETEAKLITNECLKTSFKQTNFVFITLYNLVQNSCSQNVTNAWDRFLFEFLSRKRQIKKKEGKSGRRRKQHKASLNTTVSRLPPEILISTLPNGEVIRTELPFTNTRHRYPWICSLRSSWSPPEHYCAVTLLSRPPRPTILVGAAHCTYLCKRDSTSTVPSCCCADGPENCAEDVSRCGTQPRVYEMTGEDAEILCGEWETGPSSPESSGELYNVLLPVLEIVRHPDWDTSPGQGGPGAGSDIAVFKVNDQQLRSAGTARIFPSCLPPGSGTEDLSPDAVHSGWSRPVPFYFLQTFAPSFTPYWDDFFKQWHYKMELTTCQDPTTVIFTGAQLLNPSNSPYPAGVVCAKDFTRSSCFSTGDSGSPLMVQELSRNRYYTEGILSFVKGCDDWRFGGTSGGDALYHYSENPAVYTKLSCYLPWIAEQYDLHYTQTEEDPKCNSETGDRNEVNVTECSSTPTLFDREELPCLFPFYLNGKKFETCFFFDEENFVFPVFRCPIRNITRKIAGINSYISEDFLNGDLCPDAASSEPGDLEAPLNPVIMCGSFSRRRPFAQCKNNCIGGDIIF